MQGGQPGVGSRAWGHTALRPGYYEGGNKLFMPLRHSAMRGSELMVYGVHKWEVHCTLLPYSQGFTKNTKRFNDPTF